MIDPLLRLTDAINELTQPRTHVERFTRDTGHGPVTRRWSMRVGSLLDQLGLCVSPGTGIDLAAGHAVPGSRPTASIEALDALMAIDVEVAQLADYHDVKREDIIGNLRGLLGVATGSDDAEQSYLAVRAERWVSRAKSVTGWADPVWRPDNSCPLCEERRSLRVRIMSASEMHASCVHCGETWTPDTIGLLAEHIRYENREDEIEEAS